MPVILEVCQGTTCFVMGSQELMAIEDDFPPDWKGKVEMRAAPCFNHCYKKGQGHGPYVRVDGEVIGGITPEALMELLKEKLRFGSF